MDTIETLAAIITPCPQWCNQMGCTDSRDEWTHHGATVSALGESEATIESCDGIGVETQPPFIAFRHGGVANDLELEPRQARDLAAVLLVAADRLDEILQVSA